MTISVIMTTYYKELPAYLHAALDSIWTQQIRKPDEIVLVEDGLLPAELEEVVGQWEKTIGSSLKVIRRKSNRGLALALNDAISNATGELLARMDSDDISMPERFLLQERYMEQHPEVDILGGSLREFNDAGTLDNTRVYPSTMKEIKASMHRLSPLAHPTVMFRHRIFKNGLRYSNRYFICEDITLWFDAVHAGYIINNIPDIVLRFRRNDNTMSRRARKKAFSEFKAYNHGIHQLYGPFTTRYAYSCIRLAFRLLPSKIITQIYKTGSLRNKMAGTNNQD